MTVRGHRRFLPGLALAASAAVLCTAALADEICLKDGKKLYGVIVAYEDNMFKVKTDFGYVLVEKDKIASIIPDTPTQPASGKQEAATKPGGATEAKGSTQSDAAAA